MTAAFRTLLGGAAKFGGLPWACTKLGDSMHTTRWLGRRSGHGISGGGDLLDPHCKVALVTEGTTNVGFGVAHELLRQGAEAVVITDTRCEAGRAAADRLCSQHGSERALFMQADTSCHHEFHDVFREMVRRFGGVDIMFNNPRLLDGGGWENDINTNLTSILRGCLLALDFMGRDRGHCGGVVVNNAGVEGLQPFPASPVHCAAAHGVVGATRSFQEHHGATGVRVVGLCCGHTDSEQGRGGGGNTPRQSSLAAAKAVLHMMKKATPGSIWILDDGELYAAQFPERAKFSKLVTKYV